jgi:tetratricopeptide (TPR) repeat protein
MNQALRFARLVGVAAVYLAVAASPAPGEHNGTSPNYPQSIEASLAALLILGHSSDDIDVLLRLSDEYLDAGDDLYTEDATRRSAYREGARLAKRAIELQETNAHAHFLYAAHLGNERRLAGRTAAIRALSEIKSHLVRAIALDPGHARALQFMGGLLAELPWILGGDDEAAQHYLERAVAADGNYTNARVRLAKLYIQQDRFDDALAQLDAVVRADNPHFRNAWTHRIRPEAERLLNELAQSPSP